MISILDNIAFINLKKLPGGSKSIVSEITEHYNKNKYEIILEQIKIFNPDVIIGGNTISLIIEDLKQIYTDLEYVKYEASSYLGISYSKAAKLVVYDATHPSYWKINDENYCNDIVNFYIDYSNKSLL